MIPGGVQVFVCVEPIDLRAGFDRLAGLARERIGCDARSGALFVFFGKRRETVKILYFDGSGMCLFHNQRSSHYTSFASS
jgi:transposase